MSDIEIKAAAHSPSKAEVEVNDDTIFVDTLRCTGCWTCALACMTGNKLKDGEFFVQVRTLGSGEGIDRPAGTWPNLHMSWMPVYSKSCIKCKDRTAEGKLPYCVQDCPNRALAFGKDAVEKMEAARKRGARIYELPTWEKSKEHVVYASADRKII